MRRMMGVTPNIFMLVWATAFALGLAGVAPVFSADLVVYSGRKEKAIKPVVDAFTETTGIEVALKVGKTSGLANTLMMEQGRPLADVFISTTGDVMEILPRKGILSPYHSPAATRIPAEFRSESGYWTGIAGWSRVIIYNTRMVSEKDLPTSVFDVIDPKWKGRVVIAGTWERTSMSWVSWLVTAKGREEVRTYMEQLKTIGLTNSPNYHLAVEAGFPVGVIYPDQNGIGTLVNPNAVAIVKGGPNPETAKQFVDFILSAKAQRVLSEKAYEMPLLPGVETGIVKPLSTLRHPSVKVSTLAKLADSTLDLLRDIDTRW